MTFDDGILTVYNVVNDGEPGDRPQQRLDRKEMYYYGYDRIGITRYYTAKQANQDVSAVVNIPGWTDVKVTDVVILTEQPDIQYQIGMVQPEIDDNGLRIMKLTMERMEQKYEVPGEDQGSASDGTAG